MKFPAPQDNLAPAVALFQPSHLSYDEMFAQLIISPRQQADSIKITRRGLTDALPPAPSAAPIVIMPLLRPTTSYRAL